MKENHDFVNAIRSLTEKSFSEVYLDNNNFFAIYYNDEIKTLCSIEVIDDNNVRFCIASPFLEDKKIYRDNVDDLLLVISVILIIMSAKQAASNFSLEKSMNISDLPLLSSKEESSVMSYEHDGEDLFIGREKKFQSRLMSMPSEIKELVGCDYYDKAESKIYSNFLKSSYR